MTTIPRGATVLQGGRAKAYRPLPETDRRAAFLAGLAAYDRGDFFEAHELLEPAWMGTADPAERDLHQGLIKLAAAFVHDVRGNPVGVVRNLTGARARLTAALDAIRAGARPAVGDDVDLATLVDAIDACLATLEGDPTAAVEPPHIGRPGGPTGLTGQLDQAGRVEPR